MDKMISEEFPPRDDDVIILVHGIRTFAGWQPMVKRVLEEISNTKVISIKYGYLDAIRFWCPFFTRQAAIDDLRREIQNVRAAHSDSRVSLIAHSFGTYAISRILVENPDIRVFKLVLAGAIIPRSFRWDYVQSRLAKPVLNDYGTRDFWPVLAKCLSWGYGDTGRHGFGRIGVIDRGHNYAHSDFFNEEFVRRYWKSWFESDEVVPSGWEEKAPPPSWSLSALSVVPVQWIFCTLLFGFLAWRVTQATVQKQTPSQSANPITMVEKNEQPSHQLDRRDSKSTAEMSNSSIKKAPPATIVSDATEPQLDRAERAVMLLEFGYMMYTYGLGQSAKTLELGEEEIKEKLQKQLTPLGLTIPEGEIGAKMFDQIRRMLPTERERAVINIGTLISINSSFGAVIAIHRGTDSDVEARQKMGEMIKPLKSAMLTIGILDRIVGTTPLEEFFVPSDSESVDSYLDRIGEFKDRLAGELRRGN